MVKRYLLIIFILQALISKATTYYHFTFDAKYQYNIGQDSTLKIKWICRDFTGDFADSIFVKSHTKFEKHYTFTNNFAINTIDILIYNSKGVVIGNYNQGSGLYSFRCGGYPLNYPFNGNSCNNFNTFNAGNLCLTGNFIFVKDAVHDYISYKNGHFSDPLGIYCNWEAPNQETQLKLTAPCYFNHSISAALIWQESKNGIDNWIDIDTGESIYPAKSSYTGGRMYNQNRWYRVISKGNVVKNISGNYYSEIFGPVHFYLGAKLDSVILKAGTGCNEKPDVWLYYKADSLHKVLGNPRAWLLYKASDTSMEKRWFLDTFSEWPLKIKGRKIKPETGYPVPPEKVQLLKGKYKIMYDFASWRGFDCKLYFDSFTVRENVIHEFNLTPTILSEEMCFGTKTASIKFKLNSADTFKIKISLDSQQYYDTSKIFNGLSGGLKQFFVRSNSGCTYKTQVNLFRPEPYTVPIKLDTTLCNGQILMLNAYHPSSTSYIWKKQQTTLRNTDTITISNAGNYHIFWKDKNGCIDSQGIVVKRELLDVNHDFLIATEAFLTDTVYAVNISYPVADNFIWANSDQRIKSFSKAINTLGNTFPDTGIYRIHLYSKYKACGFELSKTIHILGKNDSSSSNPKLGYKGPLIQSFSIDPNPNDGHHFTIKVQLRDTHNISIYKLDPVSGDIIGDIDLRNKKYYESTAFTDPYATPGVYYLKVVAGNEHKTIKYIVAK